MGNWVALAFIVLFGWLCHTYVVTVDWNTVVDETGQEIHHIKLDWNQDFLKTYKLGEQ